MTTWTQPRGDLRLDENSPLARGLLWVQVGHLGLDSVKGGRPTLADGLNPVTNGVSLGAGDGINAEWVSKSGTSNVRPVTFDSRRVHEELSKDDKWTLFVVRRTSGTQPSSAGLVTVPYTDSSWGVPFALLCIRRRASLDAFQVINGYGGSWEAKNFSPNNPPFEDSAWHTVAFTRDGGEFASYKNGLAGSTVSGNAGAQATSADTNQEVIVQATGSGFEYTEGETAFAGIWNRVLTPDEIRALNDNPYQVLRPAVAIPRFAPEGGGVTPGDLNAGSYTHTGNNLTALRSLTASLDAGSYTQTGNNLTALETTTATLDAGSYTLSGLGLTGLRSLPATLDAGSYTQTGNALTSTRALQAALDAGAYTLTGLSLTATQGLTAALDAGSYTLSGQDVTVLRALQAALDAGSYTHTGFDLTATTDATADLGAGSYTHTGFDLTALRSLTATLDAGSYTLTGHDFTADQAIIATVDAGSYTFTGLDLIGTRARVANLDVGSYSLTGFDLTANDQNDVAGSYEDEKRKRKEREYLEVWNSLQDEEEAETVVLKEPTKPPVKRRPVRMAPYTSDPRVRRNQQALAAVLMVI